ncbi:MAG: glycosyltransferase family 2 protein [Oligoflexia bacterium]|nr:glycosyltransferase family 2 protein [Oligoflexia bacterium]
MTQQKHSHHDVERWLDQQTPSDRAVDLSVVVPAFNEEWRLPPTLIDMVDYLDTRGISYEIIVVDDGSNDMTIDVVKKFERIRPQISLIRVPRNYGKGHAVRLGMLTAHGKAVLFADADGSTPFREVERLEAELSKGAEVVIGSRALASTDTKVITRWYRKFLGRAFNFCVNMLVLPSVADTQCGFKLFTGPAARFLFERQQSDGFSFDVEVLYIARKARMKIVEVPINWKNVPGSKVNLILDALRMFRDIMVFKVRHHKISESDYTATRAAGSPAQVGTV